MLSTGTARCPRAHHFTLRLMFVLISVWFGVRALDKSDGLPTCDTDNMRAVSRCLAGSECTMEGGPQRRPPV